MPRSGSSMTAGIFHQHGVWIGGCKPGHCKNPRGNFENIKIKQLLKDWYGRELLRDTIYWKEGFRKDVEAILDEEGCHGRWLVKHSAIYWRTWKEYNPKWVLVRRDKEATFKSCKNIGFYNATHTDEQIRQIIDSHHHEMDVVRELGGIDIFTEEIINGNYKNLERAMDYCDIDMDKSIVDEFVEPEYWHY